MKKLRRVFCVVVIALMILAIGVSIQKKIDNKRIENEANAINALNKSCYVENVLLLIDYLENHNINVNAEYKEEVRNLAKTILECYEDAGNIDSITMSNVLCIDYLYDKKIDNKTLDKMDCYYDKDLKLFKQFALENNNGTEKQLTAWVSQSVETRNNLKKSNLLKKYEIDDGLIEWFNNNVDKFTENDDDILSDNLDSVFWMLIDDTKIKKLNFDKIIPYEKKEIDKEKEELTNTIEKGRSFIEIKSDINSFDKLMGININLDDENKKIRECWMQ